MRSITIGINAVRDSRRGLRWFHHSVIVNVTAPATDNIPTDVHLMTFTASSRVNSTNTTLSDTILGTLFRWLKFLSQKVSSMLNTVYIVACFSKKSNIHEINWIEIEYSLVRWVRILVCWIEIKCSLVRWVRILVCWIEIEYSLVRWVRILVCDCDECDNVS